MTDLSTLAASLTDAQRKWLPTFQVRPFGGYASGMSKYTLKTLIDAGLVEEHQPKNFGVVKWCLSPTGLALRAYLERNPMTDELIERVARALAGADGLDWDEVCGMLADPDEGCCDSRSCVAAHWEGHDEDQARRWYKHLARAAIAAMPGWQGIESAPKDGTRILLCMDYPAWPARRARRSVECRAGPLHFNQWFSCVRQCNPLDAPPTRTGASPMTLLPLNVWIEHDGSAQCPLPVGTHCRWESRLGGKPGESDNWRLSSPDNPQAPYWPNVTHYRVISYPEDV